jgi:hypothetical protein
VAEPAVGQPPFLRRKRKKKRKEEGRKRKRPNLKFSTQSGLWPFGLC